MFLYRILLFMVKSLMQPLGLTPLGITRGQPLIGFDAKIIQVLETLICFLSFFCII